MKRTAEQLICECSHLYHDHELVWDPIKKQFSFANHGPCTKCKCTGYKEKDASRNTLIVM